MDNKTLQLQRLETERRRAAVIADKDYNLAMVRELGGSFSLDNGRLRDVQMQTYDCTLAALINKYCIYQLVLNTSSGDRLYEDNAGYI